MAGSCAACLHIAFGTHQKQDFETIVQHSSQKQSSPSAVLAAVQQESMMMAVTLLTWMQYSCYLLIFRQSWHLRLCIDAVLHHVRREDLGQEHMQPRRLVVPVIGIIL